MQKPEMLILYNYHKANSNFDWSVLGNVEEGRQNLGNEMSVYSYRLFQFALKNVLNEMIGSEQTILAFRRAGYISGIAFAEEFLNRDQDFYRFAAQLQEVLRSQRVGIVKFEKADLEKMHLVMTVAEDLDCSGLSVTDESVCEYDEGFIAGILSFYTGKEFSVREVDCWATGGRVCRFDVNLSDS